MPADACRAGRNDFQLRPSNVIAVVFWLFVFVSIVVEVSFGLGWVQTGVYSLVSALILTAVLFGWFLADAHERDVQVSAMLKTAVVASGPVALTYYKFKYFGARAGFTFLGILFLCFAVVLVAAIATDWLALSLGLIDPGYG